MKLNNFHYLEYADNYLHLYCYKKIPVIGIMVRVFANGPGDQGSIPGRVIRKTQK